MPDAHALHQLRLGKKCTGIWFNAEQLAIFVVYVYMISEKHTIVGQE